MTSRRTKQSPEYITSARLAAKYPPSPPCACDICARFCTRPGWWTVAEATRAIQAGYAGRMMLEVAPELTFGVLSPAFKGAEGRFALSEYALNGCTFLIERRCELFDTELRPLECRFCHHARSGQGPQCHADIERDWKTVYGRVLIARWSRLLHPA